MSKTTLIAHTKFIVSRPLVGSFKSTDHSIRDRIAILIAQIAASQPHGLAGARTSRFHATVRDSFLDFHGHQSGNDNPSQHHGVHA